MTLYEAFISPIYPTVMLCLNVLWDWTSLVLAGKMSWELFKVVGDWTTSKIVKYDFKKRLHHCCQYFLTCISFKISLVLVFYGTQSRIFGRVSIYCNSFPYVSSKKCAGCAPNCAGYLKMLNNNKWEQESVMRKWENCDLWENYLCDGDCISPAVRM